jgi:hypothetical protein
LDSASGERVSQSDAVRLSISGQRGGVLSVKSLQCSDGDAVIGGDKSGPIRHAPVAPREPQISLMGDSQV